MDVLSQLQQIRKKIKKQDGNSNNDPILGDETSYLDGRDSYVNPVVQHNEQQSDVAIDTLNSTGSKAITIGNKTYFKTNNGLDVNTSNNPVGYLFEDIDKQKSKLLALQSVYKDQVINEQNKLLKKGINSAEDETKLDQLNYALQNPDMATLMEMQGLNPDKDNININTSFGSNNKQLQDWWAKVQETKEYSSTNPKDKDKFGTLYVLYNPKNNQTKVGYAKDTAQLRYKTDDLVNKGWIIQDQVRSKDAASLEQEFHNIARQDNSLIDNTGNAYNQYGQTTDIEHHQLNSGSSEIYNGKLLNTPDQKTQQFNQNYQWLYNTKIQKQQAEHYVQYKGYLSNLARAVPTSIDSWLADKGEGAYEAVRGGWNDLVTSVNPNKKSVAYWSKGTVYKLIDYEKKYGNEHFGYSFKNLVEGHKNVQTALAQFGDGNVGLGVIDLAKSLKAAPEQLIMSLPDMATLGATGPIGWITKGLYTAAVYNDTIQQYRKNNNFVDPTAEYKLSLAGLSTLDTLLQTEAIHYIVKGPNILFADKAAGKIASSLDDVKLISPKTVYKTLYGTGLKILGKSINIGSKAFVSEAIPEMYEQALQDVASKLYTDKYKDKSISDLLKDSWKDIAEAGWYGGVMGHGLKHISSANEIFGEPIQEYNNNPNKILKEESYRQIQSLPVTERANIINEVLPKTKGIEKDYKQMQNILNNGNINNIGLKNIYNTSKNNNIMKDALTKSMLENIGYISHQLKTQDNNAYILLNNILEKDVDNLTSNDKDQLLNVIVNDLFNNVDTKTKNRLDTLIANRIKINSNNILNTYKNKYQNMVNIIAYAGDKNNDYLANRVMLDTKTPKDIVDANMKILEGIKYIDKSIKSDKEPTSMIKSVTNTISNVLNSFGTKKYSPIERLKSIDALQSGIKLAETQLKNNKSLRSNKQLKKMIKDYTTQLESMKQRDLLLARYAPKAIIGSENIIEPNKKKSKTKQEQEYNNKLTKLREKLNNNPEGIKVLDKLDTLDTLNPEEKISSIGSVIKDISNNKSISNETDKYRLLQHLQKQLQESINNINNREIDETTYNDLKHSINNALNDIDEVNRKYNSILPEDNEPNEDHIKAKAFDLLIKAIIRELKNDDNINTLLNSKNVEDYNNKIQKGAKEVKNDINNKGFKTKNKEYRSIPEYQQKLDQLFNEYTSDPTDKLKSEITKVLMDYNTFVLSRKDKVLNAKYFTFDFAKNILNENNDIRDIFKINRSRIHHVLGDELYNTLANNVRDILYTSYNDNVIHIYKNAKQVGSINAMMDTKQITNIIKESQRSNTVEQKTTNTNTEPKQSNTTTPTNHSPVGSNESNINKTTEEKVVNTIANTEEAMQNKAERLRKLGYKAELKVFDKTDSVKDKLYKRLMLKYSKNGIVRYDVTYKGTVYRFNENEFKNVLNNVYKDSMVNDGKYSDPKERSKALFKETMIKDPMLANKEPINLNQYIAEYRLREYEPKNSLDNQNGLVSKVVNTYIEHQSSNVEPLQGMNYIPYVKFDEKDKNGKVIGKSIYFITSKVNSENPGKTSLNKNNNESNFIKFTYLDEDNKLDDKLFNDLKTLSNYNMFPYDWNDKTYSNGKPIEPKKTSTTEPVTEPEKNTNTKNTEPNKYNEPEVPEFDESVLNNEFHKDKETEEFKGNQEDIKELNDKIDELSQLKETYNKTKDKLKDKVSQYGSTIETVKGVKISVKSNMKYINKLIDKNGEVDELSNILQLLEDYHSSINKDNLQSKTVELNLAIEKELAKLKLRCE